MKAKDLAALLLKYPELEVYVSDDWTTEGAPIRQVDRRHRTLVLMPYRTDIEVLHQEPTDVLVTDGMLEKDDRLT